LFSVKLKILPTSKADEAWIIKVAIATARLNFMMIDSNDARKKKRATSNK